MLAPRKLLKEALDEVMAGASLDIGEIVHFE